MECKCCVTKLKRKKINLENLLKHIQWDVRELCEEERALGTYVCTSVCAACILITRHYSENNIFLVKSMFPFDLNIYSMQLSGGKKEPSCLLANFYSTCGEMAVCVTEWLSPLSYSTTSRHLLQLHLIYAIRLYDAGQFNLICCFM